MPALPDPAPAPAPDRPAVPVVEAGAPDAEAAARERAELTGRLEAALREAERDRERLRSILMSAPAYIALLEGPEHVYTLSSPLNTANIGRGDPVGRALRDVAPETEAQGIVALYDRIYRTGEPFRASALPVVLREPDGRERTLYLDAAALPTRDVDGRITGVASFSFDVTEQVRARREAEASEAQLRAVTEALPGVVALVSRDLRYRYLNQEAAAWVGQPREALVGRTLAEVLGPEAFEAIRPHVERALAGETVTFEQELSYAQGGVRHVRATYVPQRGADGRVEGVVALVLDESQRRAAERRAAHLQAATSALSQALTPEDVGRVVLQEALRGVEACTGLVLRLDAEAGRLRPLAALGLRPEQVEPATDVPLDAGLPACEAARTGEPRWVPSREALLATYPVMRAHRTVVHNDRWAALPLRGRERTLGVLVLAYPEAREFEAGERAFLEAVASQAALALERAHALAEARTAVGARDEFLSVASHELRTPLTSLVLQLQLAARNLPPGARHAVGPQLAKAERQARRLGALVESLLDVSRIATGRLELQPADADVTSVVREVLERLGSLFTAAGCAVELDAPGGPVLARMDVQRADQVLVNLLSNAAKYGAGQPVRVAVRAEGGRAVVQVRDEGIGIAAGDLPRLFGRFERAVSSRHFGGLGLGLYISRQLVEAMGGSVRADGAPGRGATFTVELPLARAQG